MNFSGTWSKLAEMQRERRWLVLLILGSGCLLGLDPDQARQAEQDLFAARYDKAADAYEKLIKSDASWAPAYYGWVRALLGAYRPQEAYAAAETAQRNIPGTAVAETVLGMAAYRRGELSEAERHFRLALGTESGYAGALLGLGRILDVVSKFKTARDFYQAAYRSAPNDPECILAGLANQQEGAEHIATLERVASIYDPQTREARGLRAHIELDKTAGDRKLRQLQSEYRHYDLKLIDLMRDPRTRQAVGLVVEINQKKVKLLLDTGASGIAVSPRSAKSAGLEFGDETYELRGVGDRAAGNGRSSLAVDVRIGELRLKDVPIQAAAGVSVGGHDGVIGADIFRDFLIGIDFVHDRLSLDPFPERPPEHLGDAPNVSPAGFTRVFRFGNHLVLPTLVNNNKGHLFLIDSGSSQSLIDASTARQTTKIYADDRTRISGVQGDVNKVARADTVSLVFAGFQQDNPDLLAFDMTNLGNAFGIRLSGVLGMPVLTQLKLTIDYRYGDIRLERVKP